MKVLSTDTQGYIIRSRNLVIAKVKSFDYLMLNLFLIVTKQIAKWVVFKHNSQTTEQNEM